MGSKIDLKRSSCACHLYFTIKYTLDKSQNSIIVLSCRKSRLFFSVLPWVVTRKSLREISKHASDTLLSHTAQVVTASNVKVRIGSDLWSAINWMPSTEPNPLVNTIRANKGVILERFSTVTQATKVKNTDFPFYRVSFKQHPLL